MKEKPLMGEISFMSVVALVGLSVLFMAAEPVAAQDLKGKITTEQLYAGAPVFRENAQKFTPDTVAVKRIREIDWQLKIVMFLGTWCSDSMREAPKLLKLLEAGQGRAHDDLLQGRQRAGPHHRIAGHHDGKRFPQDHRSGGGAREGVMRALTGVIIKRNWRDTSMSPVLP
ncbi:MAG: hypothetical protein ABSB94_21095 [Syntrophorhabdales bacterium]